MVHSGSGLAYITETSRKFGSKVNPVSDLKFISIINIELNIQQAIGMVIIFPDGEPLPVPILHAIFKVVSIFLIK